MSTATATRDTVAPELQPSLAADERYCPWGYLLLVRDLEHRDPRTAIDWARRTFTHLQVGSHHLIAVPGSWRWTWNRNGTSSASVFRPESGVTIFERELDGGE